MKQEQSNSILALEVKVGPASYSGIGIKASDVPAINRRIVKHLSMYNMLRIKCVPAPDRLLVAASVEEVWQHILKSLQII